jgi:hypothetical protein
MAITSTLVNAARTTGTTAANTATGTFKTLAKPATGTCETFAGLVMPKAKLAANIGKMVLTGPGLPEGASGASASAPSGAPSAPPSGGGTISASTE